MQPPPLGNYELSPRVSSIKTRIKTVTIEKLSTIVKILREYLPLKQGLRLLHKKKIDEGFHHSESIFH